MKTELNVFIAYSRQNDQERLLLYKHLATMLSNKQITTWYDGDIELGKEYQPQIIKALDEADIVLLLISAYFLSSEYCSGVEMKHALARHARNECKVIPVIVSPCSWMNTDLGELQALPRSGHPIYSRNWHTPDEAFFHIEQELRKIILEDIEGRKKIIAEREDIMRAYEDKIKALESRHQELEQREAIAKQHLAMLEKDKVQKIEQTMLYPHLKEKMALLQQRLSFIFDASEYIVDRLEEQRESVFIHDHKIQISKRDRSRFQCTTFNGLKTKVRNAQAEVNELLENWDKDWLPDGLLEE